MKHMKKEYEMIYLMNCLNPDFHDADTECIAESLLKHARKKYKYADKYICKEDMIELIMENG